MGGMSATPTAPPPAAVAATPLAPAPALQPVSPTTPLSGNVPNANAAVAQMSPAQPATVTAQGQGHAASAPVIAGIPPMAAAAIIGAPVGTLHHVAEKFTPNERVAGTYLNGVFKGYSIAKDPGILRSLFSLTELRCTTLFTGADISRVALSFPRT